MDVQPNPDLIADEPVVVVELKDSVDRDLVWAGWTLEEILAREG